MYSFFIGCDISKDKIDISYYLNDKIIYLGKFTNNSIGFKKLIQQLKAISKLPMTTWFVCFENTGAYSKPLLHWLLSQGIPCREENALRISKSLGLRRGKDDKVDSRDICLYAFEKRDSIKQSKFPNPHITKLKKLLSRRDLFVRQKVALKVSLKDQQLMIDQELYEILEVQNMSLLELYNKHIKEIEVEMQKLIEKDDEMKKNNDLSQSVVGIGPIIASYMIAFTDNYSSFTDGRKFACYSGVAPFPNRSGKFIGKTRVNHMANKKIKSLLSNAVNTAVMYDKEIGAYYARKIAQGKAKGVVLNALKNKLIHRTFAIIKRQTPYVKMMNYI